MRKNSILLLVFLIITKANMVFAINVNGENNIWSSTPPGNNNVVLNDSVITRTLGGTCTIDRAIMNISKPTITAFVPEKPNGTSILVCPGGAYTRVVYDVEGTDIARYFNQYGITVFVLKYRLPLDRFTNSKYVPMQDAQRAIRFIRKNANSWNLDTSKIGIMGASAGGHLAASIIAEPYKTYYTPVDSVDKTSARPNFGILLYPVISMETAITHGTSRDSLIGPNPTQTLIDEFSAEKHVSKQSPLTFIALAADDGSVSPQNSQKFDQALKAAGISSKLHIYTNGGHGGGICKASGTNFSNWTKDVIQWIANQKIAKTIEVPDIYFISSDFSYDATTIKTLKEEGLNVGVRLLANTPLNKAMTDSFNAAKLVIIGRSNTSSDVALGKETWNKLTTPLMLMSHHSGAKDKLNWFNNSVLAHITNTATIKGFCPKSLQTDTVFTGLNFDATDSIAWTIAPDDVIQLDSSTNASVLLQTKFQNKKVILFARFSPGEPFYNGTCDKPWGYRTFLPEGINTGSTINGFTFTNEGKKIWLAEIKRLMRLEIPLINLSSDNGLKSITLSSGTLNPAFNINTMLYNVAFPGLIETVTVSAIPNFSCAKISGTGIITLKSGFTYDTIKVVAEDGILKNYIIKFGFITGVSDYEQINVKISPNPASSFFNIDVPNELLGSKVSITNILGKLVYNDILMENPKIINANHFKKGIYLIQIMHNNNLYCKQLIVR